MAITPWPVNSPLTQLRVQGIDVTFNRCRLMVFPSPKVTNAIRDFITANAESIANELYTEAYYKKSKDPLGYLVADTYDSRISLGVLFWGWHVDHATRIALGGLPTDFRDAVPSEFLGVLFSPGA
ncbi:hypothetical protein [Methylomonas albis]|uniref:Uncharacterized protein n=1 Tax=Methylomonas albis TaxID=1854563 RepID=A0ABR9D1J8_9GAMM|nr:hypothetical protein [Methylomonas albis]MBD9356957.1 hypothetical protein [Methylomonas albis]